MSPSVNDVLFMCTGNASRSVIAAAALARIRPELNIASAGTLVIDGLPLSIRTRAALQSVDLSCPDHRSRQATSEHLDSSRLIVAMAPEHVNWIRRTHTSAAPRTLTLVHLARQLDSNTGAISELVEQAGLAVHVLTDDEEIVDPGGGEVEGYIAAARQIVDLIEQVAERL